MNHRTRLHMIGFGFALVLLTQLPLFVMASEISADEWQKFGTSIAIATITATGLLTKEIWRWVTDSKSTRDR